MSDVLVTIITPVYNGAQYLDTYFACLSRLDYDNLQVVIVNDGSKDNSAEIINKCAASDSRICFIDKCVNQGVSAARNDALKVAKGTYIAFFDCDDTFEPCIISKSVWHAQKNGYDTVLYNHAMGKKLSYRKASYKNDEIIEIIAAAIGTSVNELLMFLKGQRGMRDGKELTGPWKMLYSADIIKTHNLEFDTDLAIGEDTIFTNEYLCHAKHVGVLQDTLYHLLGHEESAIHRYNANPEKMILGKLKLIQKKAALAQRVRNINGIELESLWGGEYILSSVQIAFLLAKTDMPFTEKVRHLKQYHNHDSVREIWSKLSIGQILSCKSVKAIPVLMLKLHLTSICMLAVVILTRIGLEVGE